MSIEWILNNNKYLISSKDHLIQLMNKGSYVSDTGDPPDDYWSSDYEQTIDIDLESDTNIVPIGDSSEQFTGTYDGGNFSITDWSYNTSLGNNTGLFGYISSSLIENINLEGTWVLSGVSNCGFLIGNMENNSGVYNVTGDFSSGHIVCSGGDIGTIIGTVSRSVVEGLTIKGSLDYITSSVNTGGVIGMINTSDVNYIRNMTRFTENNSTSAISGDLCGGVIGNVTSCNVTNILSGMIGNIIGSSGAGGIFGSVTNGPTNNIDQIVNSMTGDISSTSGKSGGVSSGVYGSGGTTNLENIANYMNGSILSPTDVSGGYLGEGSSFSIQNSILAMNGSVYSTGVNTLLDTGNTVEMKINTDFGLVYTTDGSTLSLSSLSTPFKTNETFGDLEYFDMDGTDTLGNIYSYEFVFANVSGSTQYTPYTHIAISKDDVSGPVEIQTGLQNSSAEYVYFVNYITGEIVTSPGISIVYSSGTVTDTNGSILYPIPPLVIIPTSPFSVDLSWDSIDDIQEYRVHYSTGSSVSTSHGSFSTITTSGNMYSLYNLDAMVEYSFQIYSSIDGVNYVEVNDVNGSITTPDNISSNYVISKFLVDGIYDFSGFSPDKASKLSEVIPDILGQDESIKLILNGEIKELLVAGVSGNIVDIVDGDQYILPFQSSNGSGQNIFFEGIYDGTMSYNEVNGSVILNGVEYFPGDSVIIGDTRVTIGSI